MNKNKGKHSFQINVKSNNKSSEKKQRNKESVEGRTLSKEE